MKKSLPQNQSLTIAWLYPDLMNTYADRGNIIVLEKRCKWRGIEVKIEKIGVDTDIEILQASDLIFMGGAQDTQQEIVNRDLFEKKGNALKKLIEKNIPGLFICGAYQFLGKYYITADGKNLPGIGIFPCFTKNSSQKRLIGNIAIKIHNSEFIIHNSLVVGFENHGGRTYLDNPKMAFGSVLKGFGNNGEDRTEGIVYKNTIGSYLHGPILPKNPELADWLIQTALNIKYKNKNNLAVLDDTLEKKANQEIVNKLT